LLLKRGRRKLKGKKVKFTTKAPRHEGKKSLIDEKTLTAKTPRHKEAKSKWVDG